MTTDFGNMFSDMFGGNLGVMAETKKEIEELKATARGLQAKVNRLKAKGKQQIDLVRRSAEQYRRIAKMNRTAREFSMAEMQTIRAETCELILERMMESDNKET